MPRDPNETRDDLAMALPNCRVYNSGAITLTHGATTVLTFDSEHWDPFNMHNVSSNTDRIVAPVAGVYSATINVEVSTSDYLGVLLLILHNTSGAWAFDRRNYDGTFNVITAFSASCLIPLAQGDYVRAGIFQTNTGTTNETAVRVAHRSPEFSLELVSKQFHAFA